MHEKTCCGSYIDTCVIESRLSEYIQDNRRLEKQMKALQLVIQGMYQELLDVQQEREHLALHRKILCSPVPCSDTCSTLRGGHRQCLKCDKPTCETIIRDLFKKYTQLQNNFKSKGTEVLELRVENEILKERMRQAEDAKKEIEIMHAQSLKALKRSRTSVGNTSKSCQQFQ